MKTLCTALAIGTLILSGCTTLKRDNADVEIKSSREVKITQVSIKQNGNEVQVSGMLRPNSSTVTRVGHVDVEFVGADGAVLKTVKAETNTNLFSRKSGRRPTFSAAAEIELFSSIRLIHHPDTMKQCEL